MIFLNHLLPRQLSINWQVLCFVALIMSSVIDLLTYDWWVCGWPLLKPSLQHYNIHVTKYRDNTCKMLLLKRNQEVFDISCICTPLQWKKTNQFLPTLSPPMAVAVLAYCLPCSVNNSLIDLQTYDWCVLPSLWWQLSTAWPDRNKLIQLNFDINLEYCKI